MELLRAEARRKKMSARKLARELGWSESTISRAFRSETRITIDQLEELCAKLDLDAGALARALDSLVNQGAARAFPAPSEPTTTNDRELVQILAKTVADLQKRLGY